MIGTVHARFFRHTTKYKVIKTIGCGMSTTHKIGHKMLKIP